MAEIRLAGNLIDLTPGWGHLQIVYASEGELVGVEVQSGWTWNYPPFGQSHYSSPNYGEPRGYASIALNTGERDSEVVLRGVGARIGAYSCFMFI